MKSMTGYGRGEFSLNDRKFVVEIKAVNHRYNDISVKMPRALIVYEDRIKKFIAKDVLRGKTDVLVNYESLSKDDVKITYNQALAKSYVDVLNKIKADFNMNDEISLEMVAKFPDVIKVENTIDTDNEDDEIWECLVNATELALNEFIKMRSAEGEKLKEDIIQKNNYLFTLVKKIETKAPLVAQDYKQRLVNKLKELEQVKADESRVLTEVTIFSDKACIDEEITRLYSHIDQMKAFIQEKNPIGKKLDFLIQEMNREVNTIGSKSNDVEITSIIVEAKSEIEKIREQIQNIE